MKALRKRGMQTVFRVSRKTLIVDLGGLRTVLSSAPRAGGVTRARYILNHQVAAHSMAKSDRDKGLRCADPARTLSQLALSLGIRDPFVGLMTAVSLADLVTVREAHDDMWVEGLVTVGTSNAVRAGEPVVLGQRMNSQAQAGTINLILVTNARLSTSAMVGMVQVATEAKTAVLLRAKVKSWTGRSGATGTGTDAVVVVSGNGPRQRYSGTHTVLGELVGRVIGRAVTEGLARYVRWHARRTPRSPGKKP
ncbi:MAG: adenosylcobinamide amidohydrolase [Nitrospirota bacterium]|nr:adenosylcobinamide amidohydrolase [Nitrospirota bacterium]